MQNYQYIMNLEFLHMYIESFNVLKTLLYNLKVSFSKYIKNTTVTT